MEKQQAIDIAKKIFENHDLNEVFVTSDGQVFSDTVNAESHATKTVKDGIVIGVTREEAGIATLAPAPTPEEAAKEKALAIEKAEEVVNDAKEKFEAATKAFEEDDSEENELILENAKDAFVVAEKALDALKA